MLAGTREQLDGWLAARREQVDRGELVLIAHQLDFVGQFHGGRAGAALR